MKFVLSSAFCPLDQLCDVAQAADEAGFGAISISDHLVHPEKLETPYPYTEDGEPRWPAFTDWPDPWVAIGAMGAVTERLRFISTVYVLPMRSPIQVAKTVATASVLSGGRVVLGIGAGWMREEFALMGQSFERRGARMNEQIEVIRTLWRGGYVEHHGEFYDFAPLEMSPVPPAAVPIWVGGFSQPAKRRAATLADGWISDLHTSEELVGHLEDVHAMRREAGRDADPFEVIAAVSDVYTLDGYRRMQDLGIDYLQTVPWMLYGLTGETIAEKREGIARFADDVLAKL